MRAPQRLRMRRRVIAFAFLVGCGALYCTASWAFGNEKYETADQGSQLGRNILTHDSEFPRKLEPKHSWMCILYVLGVLYMFLALAIVCDEYFVPALEVIVSRFDIPDDVVGATFMAAGGSAPELFTSLVGTFKNSAVGFGTIVGSAVFNVLFVIAMCALFAKDTLTLTWWPLARDCFCYAIGLIVLAYFYGWNSPDTIEAWEAGTLLALYVAYCVLMAYNESLHEWIVVTFLGPEQWLEHQRDKEEEALKYAGRKREIFFRMGVLAMLQGDTTHLAGIAVITKMGGGVYDTFNAIHKDKEGVIRTKDLRLLFENLDLTVTDEQLKQAEHDLDDNGDGEIDYNEFKAWYDKSEERVRQEMHRIFDQLEHKAEINPTGQHLMEMEMSPNGSADDRGCGPVSFCGGDRSLKAPVPPPTVQEQEEILAASSIPVKKIELALRRKSTLQTEDNVLGEMLRNLSHDDNGLVTRENFVKWYSENLFNREAEAEDKMRASVSEEEDEEAFDSLKWPDEPGWFPKSLYILSAPVAYLMYLSVPDCKKTGEFMFGMTYEGVGCWCALVGAITWIGIFSFFMVEWAEIIGDTAHIPPEVMGLTFLAAGTSVPDLLSSVIVAKQGKGDMAVSSSIGSNIFDILVGLPIPWLLYIAVHGGEVVVSAKSLKISILVLLGMLITVIVTIKVCSWRLTPNLAYAMIVMWIMFLTQDLLRAFTT